MKKIEFEKCNDLSKPYDSILTLEKNVMSYLKETLDFDIHFKRSTSSLTIRVIFILSGLAVHINIYMGISGPKD